jgi:hypothetical protein
VTAGARAEVVGLGHPVPDLARPAHCHRHLLLHCRRRRRRPHHRCCHHHGGGFWRRKRV